MLKDFLIESKNIVLDCQKILEKVENRPQNSQLLEAYSNNIDRIMGGARTIGLETKEDHILHLIADYSSLCKGVSHKATLVQNNDAFISICVALLLDATEMLDQILNQTGRSINEIKSLIPDEFLGRLKWIHGELSNQVGKTTEDANMLEILSRIKKTS